MTVFDRNSLCGWPEYLRLAIPATILLCSEWWAFEILTLIAGLIGVKAQAV